MKCTSLSQTLELETFPLPAFPSLVCPRVFLCGVETLILAAAIFEMLAEVMVEFVKVCNPGISGLLLTKLEEDFINLPTLGATTGVNDTNKSQATANRNIVSVE